MIADLGADGSTRRRAEIAALRRGPRAAAPTDVSRLAAVEALERRGARAFGGIDVLMNNAGIRPGSTMFGDGEAWGGSWTSISGA